MSRVRIPADVEREDRLLAGLSARQLAILAAAGVALWAGYALTKTFLPLPVFAGLAFAVAAAAVVLALGRRDGLSADRLARAALGQVRSPRRLVPAPEGVAGAPPWLPAKPGPLPAPLQLPARDLEAHGVVDLGADGAALVCEATSLNFGLRTEAEQEAVVAAFARFLNSVTAPFQVVARAERADLAEAVASLDEAAGGLPHRALEEAAREHARFLAGLAARHDVLRRQVLVVFREPRPGDDVGDTLLRRADEAASVLAAAGVGLSALSTDQVAAVLARVADPERHSRPVPTAGPGTVVTRVAPQ